VPSVTGFLRRRLKLKVNETKSAVARPQERKFLGFSFTYGRNRNGVLRPRLGSAASKECGHERAGHEASVCNR
jgi:hypothetical protein